LATTTENPGRPGVTPDSDTIGNSFSLAKLDSPERLQSFFKRLKSQRMRLESQWKLNLAFYNSKQWSYIDRLGRIQTVSTDEGDKPRYRVRLVNNQIAPGAQSLLAKFTKTRPVVTATPGSGNDSDVKAAQLAEDLLEFWWQNFELDDALQEAMLWGIIAGQGFWKITWDKFASKEMRFLLDPQGNPITNDAIATQFRSNLQKFNIPPQEQVVYLGDIKVDVLSPFNVYLDPSAKTFKDCKFAICVHYLTPDEIYTRWKVKVPADAMAGNEEMSLPYDSSFATTDKNVKAVYEAYFLPNAAMPNGRYVTWVNGPNKILEDQKWPYPTNELPIVKFPGLRVPGRIYDSSITEIAIPLQKELNKTLSQIVEYKNLTIKPRVWAPVGSLRQRMTNEPGAVYEFTPIGGLKPEIETLPTMPPYVFDHLQNIASNIKDAFYLTDVTEGTVPPNVEAGIAIDLLQETATDRVAPTIRLMETALGRAGQQMLVLAQQYYIEPRLMSIYGSGGSVQVKKFTQADIAGGITVNVEAGSGLPRTRAGRQARIESFMQMGILKPEQAWKYLDMADMKTVSKMFQSDEDMAYREHEKLLNGTPLNPAALQEAMGAVQTGINPQTNTPFNSAQEAMKYIEDAGLTPTSFENWSVHIDVHALFMKSVEFEALDEETQQRFITHYAKTFQMMRQVQPIPPPLPVRTTLALRGTVGPTGAADILGRTNPEITPEVMSEPPLDTIVMEQVGGANGEYEEAQGQLAQAQVVQTQAQTAQDSVSAAVDNIGKMQQMAHAEHAHRAKMVEHAHKIRKAQRAANAQPDKPAAKSTVTRSDYR
jgi:hypothetical protein